MAEVQETASHLTALWLLMALRRLATGEIYLKKKASALQNSKLRIEYEIFHHMASNVVKIWYIELKCILMYSWNTR